MTTAVPPSDDLYEGIPLYFVCKHENGQRYLLRKKYVWDRERNTLQGVYYVEPERGGDSAETLVTTYLSQARAVLSEVQKQKGRDFWVEDVSPIGAVKKKQIIY